MIGEDIQRYTEEHALLESNFPANIQRELEKKVLGEVKSQHLK